MPPSTDHGALGFSGDTLVVTKPLAPTPPPELANNSLIAPTGTVKLFTTEFVVSPPPI